jgi:hypothetical protein
MLTSYTTTRGNAVTNRSIHSVIIDFIIVANSFYGPKHVGVWERSRFGMERAERF